ncbi:MAG: S46 family peptidase [Myxococcota bacterium]
MYPRVVLTVLVGVLSSSAAHANEGMWQPHQLEQHSQELKKLGFELETSNLTDLAAYPMGAVVSLGGCTASFVSPEGLAVTNHHCARGSIQFNSTPEANYLRDGFLAPTRGDELPAAPGSRIYLTEALSDVTERVLKAIGPKTTGRERFRIIEERQKAIVAECEAAPGYRCEVRSFHNGKSFYLEKKLEIRDVRLVYAPADMVGRYGGDVDNWQWPRHTGDFSFYRAYVSPTGEPADYDEKNVPYKPRLHLTIEPRGVYEGDFVMVAGYPGRTQRYRLQEEISNAFERLRPWSQKFITEMIQVAEAATETDEDARIKYMQLIAILNNVEKNFRGSIEGAERMGLVELRGKENEAFQAWLSAPERREKYGDVVAELRELVAREAVSAKRDRLLRLVSYGTWMEPTARSLYRWAKERAKPDAEREVGYQERDMAKAMQRLKSMERRYDASVEPKLVALAMREYAALPEEGRIPAWDRALGVGKGEYNAAAVEKRVASMIARSRLGDVKTRLALFKASTKELEASKDPFMKLAVAAYDRMIELEEAKKAQIGESLEIRARYMTALLAFNEAQGRPIYADANGTLRISFGVVMGSMPKDGLMYDAFTTLDGIEAKHTGKDPFDVPEEQLRLIADRDHGPYYHPLYQDVPVNFLCTLDITGGNSGSPVLNAQGNLVGLAFDGTYEGIISDWAFDAENARTIAVDVRYMLWVMSKLDGATQLLEEMGVADFKRLARRGRD